MTTQAQESNQIRMSLDGILSLYEKDAVITTDLYHAVEKWLTDPSNYIPPRTTHHALTHLRRKSK